jgi:hypothetical protein
MQRNVELAIDTHTALARTVEEKRITSQENNAGVRLVSRSLPPTAPVGPPSEDVSQPLDATDGKNDDSLAASSQKI